MAKYNGLTLARHILVPRVRRAQRKKRPRIPWRQRKTVLEKAKDAREKMNRAVQKWISKIRSHAAQLAKDFDRKPRYFLDLLFQGGVKLVRPRVKTNPWNAFKWLKSRELHEAGTPLTLMEINEKYKDEYGQLTKVDKDVLVNQYEHLSKEDRRRKARRPNARGRAKDAGNTIANLEAMIEAAAFRTGLDGFFLLVRNTHDNYMAPHWYFTNESINDYMHFAVKGGWDRAKVGAKVEAFAVAGCDAANLKADMTVVEQANFLKTAIRDELQKSFQKAIGDDTPKRIFYGKFDEAVTLKYRVVLQNWPLGKIENLSKVSSAVAPLEQALAMLREGKCGFRRMEDEEYAKWKSAYLANLPIGQSEPRVDEDGVERHHTGRRVRSDKNTTRGPKEKKSKSAGGKGSQRKKRTAEAMEHDETLTPPVRAATPPTRTPTPPTRTPVPPTRTPTPPTRSPTPPTRSPAPPTRSPTSPTQSSTPQSQPQRLPSPFPDPSMIDPRILNATPPPGHISITDPNSGPADDVAGNRPKRARLPPPPLNPLLDPPARTAKPKKKGRSGGKKSDEGCGDNATNGDGIASGSRPKPKPAYRGAASSSS